jgi:hypothetical protein
MTDLYPNVWYPNTRINRSKLSKQTFCWLWRGKRRDPRERGSRLDIGLKSSDGSVRAASSWVINGHLILAPLEVTHFMAAELPGAPGIFTLSDHTLALGKLATNLLSLEAMLRFFLSDTDAASGLPQASLSKLLQASVGQTFEACALTDYDSLGALVERYNERVLPKGANLEINGTEVVTLRDALAHGRVVASEPKPPLMLVKFAKPARDASMVTVRLAEELTRDWFSHHTSCIHEEIKKVIRARQLFGLH